MKEFKDKVAVITGAASGIGRGLANRCAQEGMKVVLADVEEAALSETEKKLKSKGTSVLSVLTDVSRVHDIEVLAEKTLDTFGAVDLLFNNAGVVVSTYLWEHTLADWKWIIGVNLWGVIHGIRIFVPIMLNQNTECYIVNTASLAGLVSGGSIYGVTKHGVVSLSETLYAQLAITKAKVKVSVLCPGFVKTQIIDCERNRPPELYNDPDEIIPHHEFEPPKKMVYDMFEQGLTPEKVADIVFEGIKDEKFYILTDNHYIFKKWVKARMNGILNAFQQI